MGSLFRLTVACHPAWPWSPLTRSHAQLSVHLAEGTRGSVGEGGVSHMDLSGSRSISLASLPRPCCRAPRKQGLQLSVLPPPHPPSNHSEPSFLFLLLFLKNLLFCIRVYLINNVIVSGARQRDSTTKGLRHTYMCIHSPTDRTCFLPLLCPGCVCFLKPSP